MQRMHLFEIEDEPWCPAPVRDGATDYLQFVVEKTQPYRHIAGRLNQAIESSGATQVIDLCSGAGGPWPTLLPLINASRSRPLKVCLTDRYPNIPAWKRVQERSSGQIGYEGTQVDAGRVPARLEGFRTLFSGFHHFPPRAAARILQDAAESRQGIGVFELTERKAPAVLGMLLVPLIIALVTPAIRPFRWSRLLWTYLPPAIPFVGLFDGVVSCLRTYTPDELHAMTKSIASYSWEIEQIPVSGLSAPITYAIGTPK